MQFQEHDLKVEHISGVDNFFADALSRNPVGLNRESCDLLRKHQELLVAKIHFGIDKTLLKDLENMSHQLSDPTLAKIQEQMETKKKKPKCIAEEAYG